MAHFRLDLTSQKAFFDEARACLDLGRFDHSLAQRHLDLGIGR